MCQSFPSGKTIAEHIFFAVTCVSIFTCVMRADYNFAIGILCYYTIKRATDPEKMKNACHMVSALQTALNVPFLVVHALLVHNSCGCGMVPSHEKCVGYEALDEP